MRAVGVDETAFLRATGQHPTPFATGIADLTSGRPARLLDVVEGRWARSWPTGLPTAMTSRMSGSRLRGVSPGTWPRPFEHAPAASPRGSPSKGDVRGAAWFLPSGRRDDARDGPCAGGSGVGFRGADLLACALRWPIRTGDVTREGINAGFGGLWAD